MPSESQTTEQTTSSPFGKDKVDPRVVLLTRLLDDVFKIPGTKAGIGLDALIGLIPVVGDLATGLFGVWMYQEAKRLGVPATDRFKIIGHYVLDTLVGFIPFAGDLIDVAYKANRMSLDIIEKHLEAKKRKEERVMVDAEVK